MEQWLHPEKTMTTVALKNSVFMHIGHTGGTAITQALAQTRSITYDYHHRMRNPFGKDYNYDKRGRLFIINDGTRQYARIRGPRYSDLSELRKEDFAKHKMAVIRKPHGWYKAYWTAGFKTDWKGSNDPYLIGGGDKEFSIWINNMLGESMEDGLGFFTRYIQRFVDQPEETKTQILRFEHLAYDLHIALELLLEDWRAASIIKNLSIASQSDKLKLSQKQDGMIQMLDSWVYQFYP